MNKEKIQLLAESDTGQLVINWLEEVKGEVADIRNSLSVKAELQIEVRKAVIDVLDTLVIGRLKRLRGVENKQQDSYKLEKPHSD